MKTVFGLLIAVGLFLVIGTAGSDCDGDCMERSMSIGQIITYSLTGLVLMLIGALGLNKCSQ